MNQRGKKCKERRVRPKNVRSLLNSLTFDVKVTNIRNILLLQRSNIKSSPGCEVNFKDAVTARHDTADECVGKVDHRVLPGLIV